MKTNITTKLLNALKVSTLALILSFGVSYALAWTAPLSAPPAGNVSAPLNTSATAQTKVGQLIVGSLNAGAGTIQTTGFLSGQILTNSITFADLTTMTTAPTAGGVNKIIAGTNIALSPVTGVGNVTINARGGPVRYGGGYLIVDGSCASANLTTGTCTCPAGYPARFSSGGQQAGLDYWGYTCETL